ncbi:hypothetical protein TNCV_3837481 [Trichonephila clavipes]|nr:hypothetical protein TNCV_3837481 [Trichonephila clavipes]
MKEQKEDTRAFSKMGGCSESRNIDSWCREIPEHSLPPPANEEVLTPFFDDSLRSSISIADDKKIGDF